MIYDDYCLYCVIGSCKNGQCKKLNDEDHDLKQIICNPGEIRDLRTVISNASKDIFKNRKIHYTTCFSMITKNNECMNCLHGRYIIFEYKSKKYVLCYSEFKKNLENKVRIGIHADIVKKGVFRTVIDIEPIDDPYLKDVKENENNNGISPLLDEKSTMENKKPLIEIHNIEKPTMENKKSLDEFETQNNAMDEIEKPILAEETKNIKNKSKSLKFSFQEFQKIEEDGKKNLVLQDVPLTSSSSSPGLSSSSPVPKRKFKTNLNIMNVHSKNMNNQSEKGFIPIKVETVPSPSSIFYSKLKIEEEVVKEVKKESMLKETVPIIKKNNLTKVNQNKIKSTIEETPLKNYIFYRSD